MFFLFGASFAFAGKEPSIAMEIKKLSDLKKYIQREAQKKGMIDKTHGYLAGNLINYKLIKKYECYAVKLRFRHAVKVVDMKKDLELPRVLDNVFFNNGDAARALVEIDYIIEAIEKIDLLTERQAKTVFNLDCGGDAGVGVANDFKIKGDTLQVLGDIENGFYKKFSDIILKNPQIKIVNIGSGGGVVYDAMKAGRLIRQKKMSTYLVNNCYSACTLLFMGGVERNIAGPYPLLGFHQVSKSVTLKTGVEIDVAVPANSKVYIDIRNYSNEMGVNADWIFGKMLSASPSGMHILDSYNNQSHVQEICGAKYATWIKMWSSLCW